PVFKCSSRLMVIYTRSTDELIEAHPIRQYIRHHAHYAGIPFNQGVLIMIVLIGLQQCHAIERCVLPATHVTPFVISVAKPNRLVSTAQRLEYLNGFLVLGLVPEIAGEEIDLLVRSLIDNELGAIGIRIPNKLIITLLHQPAKFVVLLLPSLFLNIGEDIDGVRPFHQAHVAPWPSGEPLEAGSIRHSEVLFRGFS